MAVAVVAVGVAPFAEWRADRRLADERALHSKEITEERALSHNRLAGQLAQAMFSSRRSAPTLRHSSERTGCGIGA